VGHYARYLAAGGPRAPQVREWKERLQAIWAVAEPQLPTTPAGTPAATGSLVGEDVP